MSKIKKTQNWYTYNKLLSSVASYYLAIGMRSNGKTYGAKQEIIETITNGGRFVYLRRLHSYIVNYKLQKLFDDINPKLETEKGFTIKYSRASQGFIRTDNNEIVGCAVSIQDSMEWKGVPFLCDIIYFDEFMDYSYFPNEIDLFLNILSTVIRKRQNGIRIIMTGNTITGLSNPYFDLFKIPISKLKSGEILEIRHKKGAIVKIEYTKSLILKDTENKDFYFGFDDTNKTTMISSGDWEVNNVEIKNIDGFGWNSSRRLIPIYISYNGLFELSIKQDTNPIAFCRKLNNTNGIVNNKIKYILSSDGAKYENKSGLVPNYKTASKVLFNECIFQLFSLFCECFRVGRIVYQNQLDGTEFEMLFESNKYYL